MCISSQWPLRSQLLIGFTVSAIVLLVVQLAIVAGVTEVVGSLTISNSEAGMDKQITRLILTAAEETKHVISRRFQNVQQTQTEVMAAALQRAATDSFEYVDSTGGKRTGYPLSAVHESTRCNDIRPTSGYTNGDPSRSCWYYAGEAGTNNSAPVTNSADRAVLESTGKLDRWFRALASQGSRCQVTYFGLEPHGHGEQGFFRMHPAKSLPDMGPLYKCQGGYTDSRYADRKCYNPKFRSWYQKAVAARRDPADPTFGAAVLSSVYKGAELCEGRQPWMITMAKAVYGGGGGAGKADLVGVFGVDLLLDEGVQELVGSVRILEHGHASLVQADGTVISDPHFDAAAEAGTARIWELPGTDIDEAMWREVVDSDVAEPRVFEYRSAATGEVMLMAREFVQPTRSGTGHARETGDWVVLVSVPKADAHTTLAGMKARVSGSKGRTLGAIVGTTLATLLLVVAAIYSAADSITRPVDAMTRAAKSIVENADQEDVFSHLNADTFRGGNDEIGDLVNEFKEMVSGLGKKGQATDSKEVHQAKRYGPNPLLVGTVISVETNVLFG